MKTQLDFNGALVIDLVQCYNMINFSDTVTLGSLLATIGTSSISDYLAVPVLNYKLFSYQMQVEKTLNSTSMDSLIESLEYFNCCNKRQLFHIAGKTVEAAKLVELL